MGENLVHIDVGKTGHEFYFHRSASAKQIGMQQTKDFPNDLIQIYRTPCPFALTNEMMDSVNDIARAPRIRRHIGEQLFKHLEVGATLSEQTSPGRGVAGNGGEGLIEFVRERRG